MAHPTPQSGVRIGTAERDSTFLNQGLALKVVLDRESTLAPVAVSISAHASVDNANRLEADEIDFGFMAANWIGRARNGEAPFAQKIDLRMVAPMNAGPLFFITRADGSLRSVGDLHGRRVAVGAERSGMAQHARVILGTLGLSFGDVTPVYLDFAAGGEALACGDVDAQLQCPIPNPVMTAIAARVALRVLQYVPDDLAKVLDTVPFYRRMMMRRGSIRGLDDDVAQPAVLNVLVTHARTAAATVQELAAAIFAARDELPRLQPLFDGMPDLFEPLRTQGAGALEFGGVVLHDGAVAAYQAAGLLK
jgi:hypothetical protein